MPIHKSRGRPRGVDSADTRKKIINAARIEFANKGFDGAAISAIAESAHLAPSAIYHYYQSKEKLYEEVFEDTANIIWSDVNTQLDEETLTIAIEKVVRLTNELIEQLPDYSDFMAAVPVEARIHPEFAKLLPRRTDYQNVTFRALARLGIKTGEISFLSEDEATEFLRSVLMGWYFERHFRKYEMPLSLESILKVFTVLSEH
ncbi:MAG: TetR/AcrR family transcriptional regulator [Acidimicrobiales bacterium]|jgi:AcrR family transcriptional regulator|nr:TetR/AcrR family transcriptional regulator [Acidimicrobiales bacterium]MDP6298399.1 TetR/AcrR family transcriptional regulator [Acidimicrobiales bacterium]HJM28219.1 TetR/AcrR family transcriptional regulator [Acidimicrobiales bacterium]HJM96902.1 TetR/AcrR family transcriptional regulator [Acidimicrobiales bacterium]